MSNTIKKQMDKISSMHSLRAKNSSQLTPVLLQFFYHQFKWILMKIMTRQISKIRQRDQESVGITPSNPQLCDPLHVILINKTKEYKCFAYIQWVILVSFPASSVNSTGAEQKQPPDEGPKTRGTGLMMRHYSWTTQQIHFSQSRPTHFLVLNSDSTQ